MVIHRHKSRPVAMKTIRIAAARTVEFREDIEAALDCAAEVAARAETEGASLLCFPEGFLQGYLTDEAPARRNALDLASPAFTAVLTRLPPARRLVHCRAADELLLLFDKSCGGAQTDCQRGERKFWHPTYAIRVPTQELVTKQLGDADHVARHLHALSGRHAGRSTARHHAAVFRTPGAHRSP
jgi:hypothetical protein